MIASRHGRRPAWTGALALLLAGCANTPEVMRPATWPPASPSSTPVPTRLAGVTSPSIIQDADPAGTTLGSTLEGRPIVAHLFGGPTAGPMVLILGGIHGNEPTSAGVCRELLAYLKIHPEIYADRRIALITEANPDGLARKLRSNAALVDLNRNFPAANWKKTRKSSFYGGDAPLSQPETRLLVAAIERFAPVRICSLHSMDDPCNNYDGPAEQLAAVMAAVNRYPVKSNIGYPTPGSLGSWAGIDRKIPVITLELPNHGTTAKSWAVNRDALLAFIKA